MSLGEENGKPKTFPNFQAEFSGQKRNFNTYSCLFTTSSATKRPEINTHGDGSQTQEKRKKNKLN